MADQVIRVTVIASPGPRQTREWELELPAGSTVADALRLAGLDVAEVGVWGRRVPPGHVLRERDRVEAYRPLRVDPKVARRERFQRQGVRSAGLFAKKPPAP